MSEWGFERTVSLMTPDQIERDERRAYLDRALAMRDTAWRRVRRWFPRELPHDDGTIWVAANADNGNSIPGIEAFNETSLALMVRERCPNAVRVDPHGGRYSA